jgi:predicted nucleic acid-binding protein
LWAAGRGWLKPVDATHLACAQNVGVEVFETFDEALLGHAAELYELARLVVRRPLAQSQGQLL